MKQNEGTLDRVIRLIIGLLIVSLWFVLSGSMRFLALIGFIPLLTAALGWCPLYTLFGLSTCPVKKSR